MKALPYDYHRCAPDEPDQCCRKCLRWAASQNQTWGPRTGVVFRADSRDENCSYIQLTEDSHETRA